MTTNLQASRLMVRQAAQLLDAEHPQAASFCAMAKLFATDHCFNVRYLKLFYLYLIGCARAIHLS